MKPDLSVILVTPVRIDSVRLTLRHLCAQTVADRIELILIGPSDAAFDGCDSSLTRNFFRFRSIAVGPIADVDKAAAAGIEIADAAVVALVEDHVYPEPGWAAALISRHRAGPWVAVGSTVLNANPSTAFSWTNQLMAYGDFTDPVRGGVALHVSRHNISFKKEALDAYGDRLVDYLGRAGGLLDDLRAKGHRFYLEPTARIRHVNPSRLSSTLELRFFGGWLAGATRVRRQRPSLPRRAMLFVTAPIASLTRIRKMTLKLLEPQHRALLPRVFPAVTAALILDAVGQMLGIGFGERNIEARLAAFEYDRHRHLTAADREFLGGDTAGTHRA
jgi:hypothetical protein